MNRSRLALYGVLAVMGAALAWLTRPPPETYLPAAGPGGSEVRLSVPVPQSARSAGDGDSAGDGGGRAGVGAGGGAAGSDAADGQQDAPASAPAAPVAPPRPGSPEALAESAEALTLDLARSLYARSGRQFVAGLVEQGMDEADSIVIVRQAMDRIAACVVDALRAEAEEQSLRFDVLLLALEAVISDADVPEAEAMLTTASIEARTVPCVYAVAQEAGIAVP